MSPEFRDHRRRMIADAVRQATGRACEALSVLTQHGDRFHLDAETKWLVECLEEFRSCVATFEKFLPREKTFANDWKFKQNNYTAKPLLERQCKGTKTDGRPCRINARAGSLFCYHHHDQAANLSSLSDIVNDLKGGLK